MTRQRAVVITGASTGIGQATALAVARHGWLVFGGVRSDAAAERLLASAAGVGVGDRLRPIMLEVTDERAITAAAAMVRADLEQTGATFAGLVNNAGIAVAGPLETVPLARVEEALQVNVIGVVAVTQAFMPLLRQDRGRIVNVSSVSGRIAVPFLGPYAATKFALEALSDAWRQELRPWGIQVVVIEPGPIRTPIWRKSEVLALSDQAAQRAAAHYATQLAGVVAGFRRAEELGQPPEVVAATILQALTVARPPTRYLVVRNAPPYRLLPLIPDRLRDWLIARR